MPKQEKKTKGGQKRTKDEASPTFSNSQSDKCIIMSNHSPEGQAGTQINRAVYASPLVYGGQYFPPHPQFIASQHGSFPGYQNTPQYSPHAPTEANLQPTQWATDLIKDVKSIKASVAKIDDIEKLLNRLNARVETLENSVKTMETRTLEVETALQFIANELEYTKQQMKITDKDLLKIHHQYKDLETTVQNIKTQTLENEQKTNDLEARSMRENLFLFYGVIETPHEKCDDIVNDMIS
ncbi:hypothetical protein DPMN_131947 [Dreissena polymorpha]|uniref:Uncharacterized protein n=1 Tax=Dreissena polymorpha TaxID=45954 RepID=A0A9D4FV84_DREPO|nr:hypothetical protein DPMN_131947 [Dreissena polymorpha]